MLQWWWDGLGSLKHRKETFKWSEGCIRTQTKGTACHLITLPRGKDRPRLCSCLSESEDFHKSRADQLSAALQMEQWALLVLSSGQFAEVAQCLTALRCKDVPWGYPVVQQYMQAGRSSCTVLWELQILLLTLPSVHQALSAECKLLLFALMQIGVFEVKLNWFHLFKFFLFKIFIFCILTYE